MKAMKRAFQSTKVTSGPLITVSIFCIFMNKKCIERIIRGARVCFTLQMKNLEENGEPTSTPTVPSEGIAPNAADYLKKGGISNVSKCSGLEINSEF